MDGESFPRGRVTPAVDNAQKKEDAQREAKLKGNSGDLFADDEPERRKVKGSAKNKHKLTTQEERLMAGPKRIRVADNVFEVVSLTYDTLCPDMLSLGIVSFVDKFSLLITMPGNVKGKVDISSISDSLEKLFKNLVKDLKKGHEVQLPKLSDFFRTGQVVVVKVKSIGYQESGQRDVSLSMNPKDINSNYSVSSVEEDLVMLGAIESKEDNGFKVDLGIKNVVAFMQVPQKAKGRQLQIGEVVLCKITKVNSKNDSRCVVKVTNKFDQGHVEAFKKSENLNYSTLVPGMLLKPFVEEVNKTGMKVACKNLQGLIHADHLHDHSKTPSSFKPTDDVSARVLFINPTLTTPYLTLNTQLVPTHNVFSKEDRKLAKTIKKVRLVRIEARGVIVQILEDDSKGFLSTSRLDKDPAFVNVPMMEELFKGKPTFRCFIMNYSPIENMYLCSLNKEHMESAEVKEGILPFSHCGVKIGTQPGQGGAGESKKRQKRKKKSADASPEEDVAVQEPDETAPDDVAELEDAEPEKKKKKRRKKNKKAGIKNNSDTGAVGEVTADVVMNKELKEKKSRKRKNQEEANHGAENAEKDGIKIQSHKKALTKKLSGRKGTVCEDDEKSGDEILTSLNNIENKKSDVKKKKEKSVSDENKVLRLGYEKMIADKIPAGSFWDEDKGSAKEMPKETAKNITKEVSVKAEKERLNKVPTSAHDDSTAKVKGISSLQKTPEQLRFEEKGVSENSAEAALAKYWLGLMKAYCDNGDVSRARSVAATALGYGPLICNATETAKIWGALFKLEQRYGNQESIKKTWDEGVMRADDKFTFYKLAAKAYEAGGNAQEAVNIYRKHITKEFRDRTESWIECVKLYFKLGRPEDARNVFHEATSQQTVGLDEVLLASRFAITEIYDGDVNRGCMILDKLLTKIPKRTDIWFMYTDALTKKTEYDRARTVFTRAFEQSWKPHQLKGLLSRYKDFETAHGNEDSKSNFIKIAEKLLGESGLNVLTVNKAG